MSLPCMHLYLLWGNLTLPITASLDDALAEHVVVLLHCEIESVIESLVLHSLVILRTLLIRRAIRRDML